MKVVAIIGQKGGTGKTTTATGLAVAAVKAGHQTAILDLDPQTNAMNWKDRRDAEAPAVESIQPGRLKQTLKLAEAAGATYVFIDTPGKSDTAAIEAARSADLVLIPAAPQIFDLETLTAVRDALRLGGNPPAFVVLNKIHPSAVKSPDEQAAMVRDSFGIDVAPVWLTLRSIYAEAPAAGLAPIDMEPDGKAAGELEKLFAFVDRTAKANAGELRAAVAGVR